MKFILNKDKLTIEREEEESPNSGSVKYYEVEVEHDESWEGLTIEARIIHKEEDESISVAVINNKVYIDEKLRGQHYIGFIGYRIENDVKTYQISSDLKGIYFHEGAGEIEVSDDDIPTPSQWEIYIAQIQDMLDNIETNSDKTYLHTQDIASNEWNINHNLNKYPSVTVIDSANNEVIGEVKYIDNNNLIIKFEGSFSGKATLN